MTTAATKGSFVALDSDAAAQEQPADSWLFRQLAKNLNEITSEALQPAVSTVCEVADPFTGGGEDYAVSKHTTRLNAPPGAWTELVPWGLYRVPPGTRQISIRFRGKLTANATALGMCITERFGGSAEAQSGDVGVVAFTDAGSGAEAWYPTASDSWLVDVSPGPGGLVAFGVYIQTDRFTPYLPGGTEPGIVGGETSAYRIYDAEDSTSNFDRPESTSGDIEHLLEDWYLKAFRMSALGVAKIDDAGVYTSRTAEFNVVTTADSALPGTPAANDRCLFGHLTERFDALVVYLDTGAATVTAGSWVYWNGSAWAALTEIYFGITTWNHPKGWYVMHWAVPSDWAKTTIDGVAAYYVAYQVTTVTGGAGAPTVLFAQIGQERGPFSRVDGIVDGGRALIMASEQHGAEPGDMYIYGRARFLNVYCTRVLPVPIPEIT